jgi:hypothetical protein
MNNFRRFTCFCVPFVHKRTNAQTDIYIFIYIDYLFVDVLKNNSLLQLTNKNNFILQLDGALIHFAYIVHDCVKDNFPAEEYEEEDKLHVTLILRILWLCSPPPPLRYVKDQAYDYK